ncbi:hypothetical protein ACJX0J_005810, partial [Zea mays]
VELNYMWFNISHNASFIQFILAANFLKNGATMHVHYFLLLAWLAFGATRIKLALLRCIMLVATTAAFYANWINNCLKLLSIDISNLFS